ncbi:tetratricopeptide repeat protein [Nonomuraea muscovyensis]|uniref:tetratricopeptide repeat protein n=1 Tax=Nonomuraea muscovyensis TaxID=1124761 RepID=UPI00160EA92C|nr:tetratricopeptide repeat protein [Nonomuraea muscovyensis]
MDQGRPTVTAAAPIERARTLLQLRRPADAERELRGVLVQEPQNAMAHAFLAVALTEQRRGQEAVATAGEAVRLVPDFWFGHYVAGQALFRAGRYDEAIAALRTALNLNLSYAPIWEVLARIHLHRGEWSLTVDAARRGLEIDPEESDLVSLLALGLSGLGQTAAAGDAAAQAVRLSPESALAHLVYGRAALARGRAGEAAEAFREVLRLDPSFGQARDLLVAALKQRNPLYRWLERLRGRFFGGWRLVLLLPVAPPLIAVFVLIALLHWAAWVAEAFTTLRLTRARATSLLFEAGESRVAVLCCGLLAAGAALLALGIALAGEPVGTAGVAVMALVTPVQEAAHTGSPLGRRILFGWVGLLAVAAIVSAALGAVAGALLSCYAALATIWIAAGVRRLLAPAPDPV